jgi:hypothetical protein
MKNIKIFLASSKELLAERREFELQIYRKNKLWEKHGVFLSLNNWEDLSAFMERGGSQSGYNEVIENCDIFVLLAHTKVGKYTEEEFDTAYRSFLAKGKPLIVNYFKEKGNGAIEPSLDAFQQKLKSLEYFYPSFDSHDSLWSQFNKELDRLESVAFKGFGTRDGVTQSHPVTPPPTTQGFPRVLTQNPYISDFFIGRDTDLADIHANFQSKKLLVLVNGEGGMGKTTLAAHYWQQHEGQYAHLAWIFAERGVGNALVSLKNELGVDFDPKDDLKTQVARITQAIGHLNAPILLVLDNANDAEDLEDYLMVLKSLTNCHVLLTSRVLVLDEAEIQRILPLAIDFARQVFIKHYPKHADVIARHEATSGSYLR